MRTVLAVSVAVCLAHLSLPALSQGMPMACGDLANHYGPFDYRTSQQDLKIVESGHFPAYVEALARRKTGPLGTDIGYVLHTSPNHHRALVSMMRLAEREKRDMPLGARYSVDCYFERALRFRPDDTVARLLYCNHLVRRTRYDEARTQLKLAKEQAADNGLTHYNIGLLYFDMKDYDAARQQAHIASKLGHPGTGLKTQLEAVGQWQEDSAVKAVAPQPTLTVQPTQ